MNLEMEILKSTCSMYANLNLSRTDTQFFINLMQNFIKDIYNPFLLDSNKSLESAVDSEVSEEIRHVFKTHKIPLKNVIPNIKE